MGDGEEDKNNCDIDDNVFKAESMNKAGERVREERERRREQLAEERRVRERRAGERR